MKKVLSVLFSIVAGLYFFSCTPAEETTSISFSFDESKFRSSSRNAVGTASEDLYHFYVSISGDYSASTEVSNESTVTFYQIPVGSKIYVQAMVYDHEELTNDNDRRDIVSLTHYASSSSFTVSAGENEVSLSMKEYEAGYPRKSISVSSLSYHNYSDSDGTVGRLYLYNFNESNSSGKFRVLDWSDDSICYVEGVWFKGSDYVEGSGGTLYLMDCVYMPFTYTDENGDTSLTFNTEENNYVMISSPTKKTCTFVDGEMTQMEGSITFDSGLTFTFGNT